MPRRPGQQLLRNLIYAAARGAARGLTALPPAKARATGRVLGRGVGACLPYERRLAAAHLAQAFPECTAAWQRRTVGAMFAHLGETAVETLHMETLLRKSPPQIDGLEVLQQALAKGRGAVVVTGHIGNWELLAAAVAARGLPVSVVARRIYDPRFDRWMQSLRAAFGIETIVRSDRNATRQLLMALKGNRLLGLLVDQDTDVPSVWAPFFGRPAKTPVAPAKFARRGVPVIAGWDRRLPDGRHRLTFTPVRLPDDPPAAMTTINQRLAAAIAAAPEQWVWHHRRWRSPAPADAVAAQT